ncbi:MAG: Signal recognition particle receptor FtsY [Thermococcales archaeon 44_46]|jgi:fused signal recognition particle receptor|uniref:signal recognition particle-docking protein FtsY n=1 Tax=Thermococcus TaxID=2263 RepID=UPI0007469158|nr:MULTISPECIES: signal recognition particle-docking protein FtsY [Thermococcus]KUK00231.1 MAG: Signal recognition particle receptor FtsY [Thermococcales archaeon 44_46]MDK2853745.1 fused signal recognition particle receptor [Thermococcaceae archaeon]MCA6213110.1 signal recognition particle-docking protein FtsY [Thermococcus bergensis]MDK2983862.1 fused signal recognition particle receptor [Thermococcaceae archaeon]MPW38128.1 signal recognition particle-docking protein FtsY [Thermococcus sp. 1
MFGKLKEKLSSFVDKVAQTEISEKDVENALWDLELELLEADVALEVVEELKEKIKQKLVGQKVKIGTNKKEIVEKAVKEAVLEVLTPERRIDLLEMIKSKQEKPFVIVFVGFNGSGKTTTIAKLASWLKKNGFSVVIAASDTFRAGAIEQVEEHAKRVGVKLIKHGYKSDPAAVAYDAIEHAKARGIDVVLVDTAGRNELNRNLMDEMKKIVKVAKPDLVIFVGDALAGNAIIEQARQFNEAVKIDGVILTKLDADARGGAALSIAHAIGAPILFVGVGQGYGDLMPFDEKWMLEKIFGE